MMETSKNIGVVGAGLMGHGIALVMARAGHTVFITDPFEESRNSVLDRIETSLVSMDVDAQEITLAVKRVNVVSALKEAVENADFVFEAAPEKLELKQSIFAEIEEFAPANCILASNTSVIQISKIMEGLKTRHRALGTHWWNPAHMIPLVEVIRTQWVDDSAMNDVMALLEHAGKSPVRVEKDVPGFIGNRLQHALWREAISLVERGICDAEAVDTVIKQSFGRRLAVLGPLENADLIGIELTLDIHENVLFDLEGRNAPSPMLKQMIKDGKLGMKSGEGFRKWSDESAQDVRAKIPAHLQKLAKILTE